MASWQDLEKRKDEPQEDRLAELCAQVFTTAQGRELLAFLRRVTIEVTTHAAAPECYLRDLEGQRRLVRRLEQATERGLELAVEAKKKAAKPE